LRLPCLLPSRQRESKFEEPGKRPQTNRLRKNNICLINGVVRWRDRLFFWFQQWQRNEWCAFKPPKRIRLIRPIQITKRTSIAIEMMFGLDGIADDPIVGIGERG